MIHPFSVTAAVLVNLQGALSTERLSRYYPAANNDPQLALRLYVWNARLCEAFYFPCQMAEVTVRNALHRALAAHFGRADWYRDQSFLNQSPRPLVDEIFRVMHQKSKDHGGLATHNHMISGLSFGFWTHMLTINFERCGVWPRQIPAAFPFAPCGQTRQAIYNKIDLVRKFRNRIAHQGAIFDKRPQKMHQEIMDVIGWSCEDARWLAASLSRLSQVINARPRV